jgi:hypothetical protein
MDPKYEKWIEGNGQGLCVVMSKNMAAEFPELHVVYGFARGREHAWCVTPNGEIIDPTIDQLKGQPVVYEPFRPGDTVRVGRCMFCGEPIYASVEKLDDPIYRRSFCDEDCSNAFESEL